MISRWLMASILLVTLAMTPAWSQTVEEFDRTTVVIHLAPAPRPALKYRILPERDQLVPGNAALFYHRALGFLYQNRRVELEQAVQEKGDMSQSSADRVSDWLEMPLDEFPVEEARTLLESNYQRILNEVELGAFRESCDWGLDNRPEGYDLLLTEMQESRELARLVALRARVAIADGEVDVAWHWIQVGFALSRHVAEGPSLIQGLIGQAESGLVRTILVDLIGHPDAPNLYWALANRPRPFIDLTATLETDLMFLRQTIPSLEDLDGEPWGLAKARQFREELLDALGLVDIQLRVSSPRWAASLALAGLVAQAYPTARAELIEQGMDPERVKAMPAIQVVGLQTYQEFEAINDDALKYTKLPYWQAVELIERAEQRSKDQRSGRSHNLLMRLFLGVAVSASNVVRSEGRYEQYTDLIQTIEAIRLYADAHDGRLPESLNDLVETPAPINPSTGQPFTYRLSEDGRTASLEGNTPGLSNQYTTAYTLRLSDDVNTYEN